jgi:hypothetical protein
MAFEPNLVQPAAKIDILDVNQEYSEVGLEPEKEFF